MFPQIIDNAYAASIGFVASGAWLLDGGAKINNMLLIVAGAVLITTGVYLSWVRLDIESKNNRAHRKFNLASGD